MLNFYLTFVSVFLFLFSKAQTDSIVTIKDGKAYTKTIYTSAGNNIYAGVTFCKWGKSVNLIIELESPQAIEVPVGGSVIFTGDTTIQLVNKYDKTKAFEMSATEYVTNIVVSVPENVRPHFKQFNFEYIHIKTGQRPVISFLLRDKAITELRQSINELIRNF